MFELGKVAGSGMVQQDGKTGSSKRRSFGEEAINSIMDNYKSGKTNNNKGSHQDVKEKNNYDDYNKFNNLMEKSKLSNSPLKEADLLANGFKKNDLRDKNGGVYYTNPKTGEEIRLCNWEGSNIYVTRDGKKYTQYFDKSGKPAGGEVTVTNKNGSTVTYKYENDIAGNKFITDVKRTDPPEDRREEMAAEGMKKFQDFINDFEEELGIPDKFLPVSGIVIKDDGSEEAVRYSEDGKYKITIQTDKDGSRTQTYSRISAYSGNTPVYEEIGTWSAYKRQYINPETGEGEGPYDWGYRQDNYITGIDMMTK